MTETIDYRLSTNRDLVGLADLRWRLQTDDRPIADNTEYDRFVGDFVRIGQSEPRTGELFHWVACSGDRLLGAMSVILVRKLPKPGNLDGRWGYLTNCYVLPEMRNLGVGGSLLSRVKSWARELELELLVVWPSDWAFRFYERGGFTRPADPLVLAVGQS
jgi:GNAT superfamily N-acetyltransferase